MAKLFSLVAIILLLAPFAGAMAAAMCAEDCCCGSTLTCSCNDDSCITSQPASPAPVLLSGPSPLLGMAALVTTDTPADSAASHGSSVAAPPEPNSSPPPLFVQHNSFLI